MRRESDNKILHNIATGVDIVNAVCIVSSIIDSAGKVVKIVINGQPGIYIL